MAKIVSAVSSAATDAHRAMKELADPVGTLLVDAFHLLALFVIGATTVWSAAVTFVHMATRGRARIEDILLLFIYLEIGATVGIYFKTTRLPVRYLIYIAMPALAGAEHRTGFVLVVVAGAILILSFAELVLRFGSYKFPSDAPGGEPEHT